jgi:regulator of RNase E activity RraA
MSIFLRDVACTGMFSDELDKMGYRNQVIQGLISNHSSAKIYGHARTILIETMETNDENISIGLGFLEQLNEGDVLCVQASAEFAYFGELMTRLSIRQKLGGAVIGGLTRDSVYTINKKDFSIFAVGFSPKDIKGRGRVHLTDVSIVLKGISINPGDWIFADTDGVVVIPAKIRLLLEEKILKCVEAEKDIIKRIDENQRINEILSRHKEF